jgi:hypothetical protein
VRCGKHEGQSCKSEATGENAVARAPSGVQHIIYRGHGNSPLLCLVPIAARCSGPLPRSIAVIIRIAAARSADRGKSAAPLPHRCFGAVLADGTRRSIQGRQEACYLPIIIRPFRQLGDSGRIVRCSRADILQRVRLLQ